jgi:SAM-dependent methyltransferase
MYSQLLGGIPKEYEYRRLIDSNEFKKMEEFSDNFVSANQKILSDYYANRWVKDPLHQWSRQWEYPYVFSKIQSVIKNMETTRILDAGSGVTFFPYYIKSSYSSADIYCADNDENFEEVYQHINAHGDNKVRFSCCDLKKLPYEDDWFDVVYCVSVLEHTDDYTEILDEFRRVLRPGGSLVITFDVSLDGTRDISVEKGEALLSSLAERFNVAGDLSFELKPYILKPDIFTTFTAKKIDPHLLPWKFPPFIYQLRSLITQARVISWPPLLSVFCTSLTKL